ncbi:hypothetical protein DITRI_Ditri13aG0166600 [Diplodiscus trichospermus]
MKRISFVALCVVALMVVVFSGETPTAGAVTCVATELSPCLPAITSPAPPSDLCCGKLREQQPCLCGYLKDPSFKQFIDNPRTKVVASTCGVSYPKC